MLSSHSVNQVDAQPLGLLKALGVGGRHKQVQVVGAATITQHTSLMRLAVARYDWCKVLICSLQQGRE